MPWFPDFASAIELARREARAEGQADPVGRYFAALNASDSHPLEDAWPGEVVIYDPRAGEVRGRKRVRAFVRENQSWLAGLQARTETIASTVVGWRAVVELLAHVVIDGRPVAWPVTVVAECPDDGSAVFRSYCSQWPISGRHQVRPPVREPVPEYPPGVVGRYLAALAAGDADAVVGTFAPGGYLRETSGPDHQHRGPAGLRAFYTASFSAGGGIMLAPGAITDDGTRCALEYTLMRWGAQDLPPQAGIAVFERSRGGLLAAVRVYDDVQAPVELN
jgi:SnoaL-like domain